MCLLLKLMTSCLSSPLSSGHPPVRSRRPSKPTNRSRSAALPSTTSPSGPDAALAVEAWGGTTSGQLRALSATDERSRAKRLQTSFVRPAKRLSCDVPALAITFWIAFFRVPADFLSCSRCLTSKTSSGRLLTWGFMSSLTPPSSAPDIEVKKRPTLSAAPSNFHVSETSSALSAAALWASARSSEDRFSGSVINGPSSASTLTSYRP
mmetsp:Transcript_65127/g.173647  ORF Transcript_65127/g.173647 Transcript_65127/m.173647 type:complete len:208 (+) Transcript_65127:271-894(+)